MNGSMGAEGRARLDVEPVERVRGVRAYATERVPQPIDLRLDANEGPAPAECVMNALASIDSERLRRYPSSGALEAKLAQRLGCAAERVLVTAGGDDGLDRACRAVLGPGREIIVPTPTFEMIPRWARLTGADVVEVAWGDKTFPVEAILSSVTERTAAVAVVTPNNPTGLVATSADVARLARALPKALIMLDLAYTEFAEEDLTGLALTEPNVVAFRTMSKAWGLAGLRVGYAVGDERVIGWMRACGGPYAVSGPALALAEAALEGVSVGASLECVRRERALLRELLSELGAGTTASEANFVLARFEPGPRDEVWVRDALAGLGVLVRRFVGRPELAGALRITCPGEAGAFGRLARGLRAAVRPEAMLFDLDGVLADVSGSYRRAIVETAAGYSVRVTPERIAAAKARGNANNDWILTRELLAEAGVERPLEEVTARFEAIYQGDEVRPGLRSVETLLCEPAVLRRLSVRLPLAIVTGRPRADAERFLSEKGIRQYFRTLVCMEDAPNKPAPDPALRAMSRLGVGAAWMIGDTVDDVRCARAAGVVPLGVVQPGEAGDPASRAAAAAALLSAGAARVLDRVEQLEELLP